MQILPNLDLSPTQIWETKDTPMSNSTPARTRCIEPLHLHLPNLFCLLNSRSQPQKPQQEVTSESYYPRAPSHPPVVPSLTHQAPPPTHLPLKQPSSTCPCLGSGPGLVSLDFHASSLNSSIPSSQGQTQNLCD